MVSLLHTSKSVFPRKVRSQKSYHGAVITLFCPSKIFPPPHRCRLTTQRQRTNPVPIATSSLLFARIVFTIVINSSSRLFTLTLKQSHPRKNRKSVAFTDEKIVVDSDGHVTMIAEPIDDSKETAQSHTPRTPPLSAALGAFTDASQAPATDAADDDGLDLSLMKKKKKKVKKTEDDDAAAPADGADGADGEGDDAAGGEEGALDLTLKKKKKKKTKESEDDFAKKLEALQLEGKEGEAEAAPEAEAQVGDMEKGTGIWEHDETKIINYDPLLSRFFALLTQKNPDHASSGSKSYKIPPPQCLREGNKKTIFANIADICKRMKRTEEHVTAYLFSELGTSGSVDGSRRLVIKGRFQQKQIENVLRKYISKCPPPQRGLVSDPMTRHR